MHAATDGDERMPEGRAARWHRRRGADGGGADDGARARGAARRVVNLDTVLLEIEVYQRIDNLPVY